MTLGGANMKNKILGLFALMLVVPLAFVLVACGGENYKLETGTYKSTKTDFATDVNGVKYNLVCTIELKSDNTVAGQAYLEKDGEQIYTIQTDSLLSLISGTAAEILCQDTVNNHITPGVHQHTLSAIDFSSYSWKPTYTKKGESNKTDTLYFWGEDKGNAPMASFVVTANNKFVFANGKSAITPDSMVFTKI